MQEKFIDYGIKIPVNATGNIKTTCPKCSHKRKKSKEKCLSINIDEGVWNCHHCGWSNVLKSNNSGKNMNKPKSYKKPKWESNNKNKVPNRVLNWFKNERKISNKTLEKYDIQVKIKYIPGRDKKVKSIAFPYKENNKTVNIKYRDLEKNWTQSKNGKKILFGLDRISENEDTLIITEGELDTLAAVESGLDFVVSVPNGAPNPNAKNLDNKMSYLKNCEAKLKQFDNFILAVDGDANGNKLRDELGRRLGYGKCYKVKYPDGIMPKTGKKTKDLNDVLIKYGKNKVKEIITNAQEYPIEGVFTFEDTKDKLLEIYDNGYEPSYSTGFGDLNEYYKVRSKEFTIITGIPSHGKSEFLDSVLTQMVNYQNWKFAIFSPENGSVERHQSKMIGKLVGNEFRKASRKEVIEGIDYLNNKIHSIDPKSGDYKIDFILNKTRSLIYRYGINALIIDPYNELYNSKKRDESETKYISRFLSKIRKFVRRNDIHCFIVAHPTKPGKSNIKPPTAYDIAGSANWYNKADNIISVFRTENDFTKIFVQKVRFAEVGHKGEITLNYDLSRRNYKEAIPDKF